MRRLLRKTALLCGLTAIIAVGVISAPVEATPKPPAPIGYIYAGTISHGIDTLAVAPDHTLSLVTETPSPNGYVGGVALLHTASGLHLYVLAGRGAASIYQYAVNRKTGAIKLTTRPIVTGLLVLQRGNNLFAYDGHATDANDSSTLFALKCLDDACSTWGIATFRAAAKTGALKPVGTPKPREIESMSVQGDRMDILVQRKRGDGVVPLAIHHKSGKFSAGGTYVLTTTTRHPKPTSADQVATGPANVGVGDLALGDGHNYIANLPSNGTQISGGGDFLADNEVSAMTYVPRELLAGEATPAGGPYLQILALSGGRSGQIDLTKPPYNLTTGGGEEDPNFPETIFALDGGVYIGMYDAPIVQGTDTDAKDVALNQTTPTVTGTGSTTSMDGYLLPRATKTTLSVKRKPKVLRVTGTVTAGSSGVVSVTLYAEPKKKTSFHEVGHKDATLTTSAHYSASFRRPTAKRCRVTANYTGDASSTPSKRSRIFAC